MPKNPAHNIDRYKIDGRQLNEFEFAENQTALAQEDEAFRQQQGKKRASEGPTAVVKKASKKPRKKAPKQ